MARAGSPGDRRSRCRRDYRSVSAPVINGNMQAAAVLGRIVNVGRLGGGRGEFDFDLHATKRISYVGVTNRPGQSRSSARSPNGSGRISGRQCRRSCSACRSIAGTRSPRHQPRSARMKAEQALWKDCPDDLRSARATRSCPNSRNAVRQPLERGRDAGCAGRARRGLQ